MKKIISVLAIAGLLISTVLVSANAATVRNNADPYAGDGPSFIKKGKVDLSDESLTKTYYGPVTITFKDKNKKQVDKITIPLNPVQYPTYTFEYHGKTKQVSKVTYQENYFGVKIEYGYDKNGTLKSYDRYAKTGMNYGNKQYLAEHRDYKYTYYGNSNKIKTAERITTTYDFNGNVLKTTVEKLYFDKKGNLIPDPNVLLKSDVKKQGLQELDQKLMVIGEKNNANALPQGVVIVGDLKSAYPDRDKAKKNSKK